MKRNPQYYDAASVKLDSLTFYPLEDITNVRRLQLVLKEGRVVSDKRHLSGAVR